MKIAYYMPFKPMGHTNPSGDLVTGTELFNHLSSRGHDINLASNLRCRWVYYRPLAMVRLLLERKRLCSLRTSWAPDLWLSYHSYYKAPDLLGPFCSRKLYIPYVIFQGIYSTKRRRNLKSLPGFLLNRRALLSATHVFTNKRRDFTNLQRLLAEDRLSYIAPGIDPQAFRFSHASRKEQRRRWGIRDELVVMTAAMMRPGVKTAGLRLVIDSCRELIRSGVDISLVIVGDGSGRRELEQQARQLPQQRVHFVGKIERQQLFHYYSGADIFAFPGIEESLGMVYLEAQSCGLPVVAFEGWGGGEAVLHKQTGLLSPGASARGFTSNIRKLAEDDYLRLSLAAAARVHITQHHDLKRNYTQLEHMLLSLCRRKQPGAAC